ncbi:tripartite motif-containing protein 35-like [Salvelinus namaycush]|uniref:Tripartite motif-containing protein 35-like n=1 Tax=Salvelinus namaycush TaxID=8040 RepID=A0A8U0PQC4_SALNM|nr:tripartite motif-containing protein 35-like [Salvelinus namaycush]
MSREISSLSYTIKATEQQLSIEDISFLQNYKATETRAKQTLPDPKRVSGALIDVAKHLGNLQLRVREKMKGMVQYCKYCNDPGFISAEIDCAIVDRITIMSRS